MRCHFRPMPLRNLRTWRRLAAKPGQLLDPLGRPGDGPCRLTPERLADAFAVGGQVADGADDVPAPQPIEAAVAEGGDVTLDGGAAQSGDLGGLLTGQPAVQQPQDEHLAADMLAGVGVTLGVDDGPLLFGQLDAKPPHRGTLDGPPGEVVGRRTRFGFLRPADHRGNVSLRTVRSIPLLPLLLKHYKGSWARLPRTVVLVFFVLPLCSLCLCGESSLERTRRGPTQACQ